MVSRIEKELWMFSLILLTLVCFALLGFQQVRRKSFSVRVFSALALALTLALIVNGLQGDWISDEGIRKWIPWLNVVGYGYVDLLKMVSIPLIMISIISALAGSRQKHEKVGRTVGLILLVLLSSVVLAALISLGVSTFFSLNSNALTMNETAQLHLAEKWQGLSENVKSIPEVLRSLIPKNIFVDLAGLRNSSIAGVVVFSLFLSWGFFSMSHREENRKDSERIQLLVGAFQKWILALVRNILQLAPYGIFAIVLRVMLESNFQMLLELGKFAGSTYLALSLVFLMHLLILFCFGYSPRIYLQKAWPALSFAFMSRSSSGALPLAIETQEKAFGLDSGVASISASLGTTIGQNGCAGVYPTMLVVMIWNAIGQNIGPAEVFSLLGVILISSFGVAGVGGGATFASIMTLALLGLEEHLDLAVVLFSIESFLDMGRTLVNVSGSMLSGLVTGSVCSKVDWKIYHNREKVVLGPAE